MNSEPVLYSAIHGGKLNSSKDLLYPPYIRKLLQHKNCLNLRITDNVKKLLMVPDRRND